MSNFIKVINVIIEFIFFHLGWYVKKTETHKWENFMIEK